MNATLSRALLGGAFCLLLAGGSLAQTTPAAPAASATPTVTEAAPVIKLDPSLLVPPEMSGTIAKDGSKVPNETIVIPPVKSKKALHVGVYEGLGALPECIEDVKRNALSLGNAKVTLIKAEDFAKIDLSQFDVLAFPGGLSSNQGKGLGKEGRDAVVRYVYNGGGYLGICAGAYLATTGNDWSLGIMNARTVSPNWLRGIAFLKMQLSPEGQKLFNGPAETFYVRYNNGPIIEPANKPELPPYKVDAYFRTEVDGYKSTPVGIQVNSPAVIRSTYGKGRVFSISPHPECSRGLENFIPRALVWLGDKSNK